MEKLMDLTLRQLLEHPQKIVRLMARALYGELVDQIKKEIEKS